MVPLVGNVAMDAVMADVTDVPGRPVDHTDEFVLMGQDGGERITALDLAQARTTNTWEVVTGMARRYLGCTMPRLAPWACGPLPRGGVELASIELWNGDICDLEVDAIVNPANLSLWMATGVGGALKRAGGDAIEFAAVRQAPVPLGEAVVTLRARSRRAPSSTPYRSTASGAQGARHRDRRSERHGPGARDRCHEHRVPGAGNRCRWLSAR